jgi:hypothetical protein
MNGWGDDLNMLQAVSPCAVIRVSSGIKLLQGGLELANVGIISAYTPDAGQLEAVNIGAELRKIRSLLGMGLRLADVAALEAPWFLDRNHADKYQAAVFANNALLANALANEKTIFETVAHPILDCGCGVAPFCVLSLKEKSRQANARLEQSIKEYSRRRQILFEQGEVSGLGATGSKWCSPMTRLRRFCCNRPSGRLVAGRDHRPFS